MSVHLGWHDDLVLHVAHSLGRTAVWGPAAAALILVLSCPSRAVAQRGPAIPEFRPFVGTYVPIGKQRHLLDRAMAVGAQAALEFGRGIHGVAGFSWVPTQRRTPNDPYRVEMAQFDLGAEWLTAGAPGWRVSPLLGAGVGLRAYRNRDKTAPSQANVGGYGALGFELAAGRVAFRLEGRNYLTAFRGLEGGEGTSARSDATVIFALGYHMR
jgi:hypothetical protein